MLSFNLKGWLLHRYAQGLGRMDGVGRTEGGGLYPQAAHKEKWELEIIYRTNLVLKRTIFPVGQKKIFFLFT